MFAAQAVRESQVPSAPTLGLPALTGSAVSPESLQSARCSPAPAPWGSAASHPPPGSGAPACALLSAASRLLGADSTPTFCSSLRPQRARFSWKGELKLIL